MYIDNHIMLRLPKWVCRLYLRQLDNLYWEKYPSKPMGLLDGEVTNKVYDSRRSRLAYVYLDTPVTKILNWCIARWLELRTGKDWSGGINAKCAPINVYGRGCYIKVHRDRNMLTGKPVEFIATIMLEPSNTGGRFLYNAAFQTVSLDGKEVELHKPEKTKCFHLKQGQVIVLRNTDSVHGVEELHSGRRVSLTFRSR